MNWWAVVISAYKAGTFFLNYTSCASKASFYINWNVSTLLLRALWFPKDHSVYVWSRPHVTGMTVIVSETFQQHLDVVLWNWHSTSILRFSTLCVGFSDACSACCTWWHQTAEGLLFSIVKIWMNDDYNNKDTWCSPTYFPNTAIQFFKMFLYYSTESNKHKRMFLFYFFPFVLLSFFCIFTS